MAQLLREGDRAAVRWRGGGRGVVCPAGTAGYHPRATFGQKPFRSPHRAGATLDPVEDRSPPRFLVPSHVAFAAAWVLIGTGLLILFFLPWGRHWWTVLGGIAIFAGLALDWRARLPP